MGMMSCSPGLQQQADKTSLTKDPIDPHSCPWNWISCIFAMTSAFASMYTYQATTFSVPCVLSKKKKSNDHVFLHASCPTTRFFSLHLLETHFRWLMQTQFIHLLPRISQREYTPFYPGIPLVMIIQTICLLSPCLFFFSITKLRQTSLHAPITLCP